MSLGAKLSVIMRRVALIALALASACAREPDMGLSTGPGATSVPLTSTSTSTSSSTGESSSTSDAEGSSAGVAGSSSGGVPDMGLVPDFGPVQPGCQGKIDFVFLISRLGTMTTEQTQLLASLPGFIATIEATFPDFDMHVIVANPDGNWLGWNCEIPELCGTKPYTCDPYAPGYECGPDTWDLIKPCDETLGAGILFNVGLDATNHPCVLAEGRRYIALPGEPDPKSAFACIAPVGYGGGDPPMAAALVATVSPELNAEDGCNAGFLRSDALLVVTMITDVEDDQSPGEPAAWYEAIVAAKGDPRSVVMLAVQPQALVGEKVPGCTYDGDGKLRLRELIKMFPFHDEGDTCADSYVPFFEDAVGLVAEACGSFIPQ
jgi:hypothetical protein